MWGVIAIIILVLLLFGSILEQNDLKHQLEVKEYEVKRLKDKLEKEGKHGIKKINATLFRK